MVYNLTTPWDHETCCTLVRIRELVYKHLWSVVVLVWWLGMKKEYLDIVSLLYQHKLCSNLHLTAVDGRPEEKFLNRHVRQQLCAKSAHMWKDLGVELLGSGNSVTLDVIKNSNSDATECCSAMFQLWLDRQPAASWRQLIKALKQLQLNHLANEVESKLTIPVLEPSAGIHVLRQVPI